MSSCYHLEVCGSINGLSPRIRSSPWLARLLYSAFALYYYAVTNCLELGNAPILEKLAQ